MSDTEYIPRDAVDNVLLKLEEITISNPFALTALAMAVDKIDNIPAADVAPVVYGHWKYERDEGHSIYTGECSVCGYRRRIDQFCGKCGANMDESEDSGNV